jgi:hypothetical protein
LTSIIRENVDILAMAALLIMFLAGYQFAMNFLLGDSSGTFDAICDEYDGDIGTNDRVKREWVLSDNIMSYEELPEDEKKNLSNASIEILKRSDSLFVATNYSNLSAAQKEIFRASVNESEEPDRVNSRDKVPTGRIIYRGEIYSCELHRTQQTE